jgi:hypothetical protein
LKSQTTVFRNQVTAPINHFSCSCNKNHASWFSLRVLLNCFKSRIPTINLFTGQIFIIISRFFNTFSVSLVLSPIFTLNLILQHSPLWPRTLTYPFKSHNFKWIQLIKYSCLHLKDRKSVSCSHMNVPKIISLSV